jgi:hypothetical protein
VRQRTPIKSNQEEFARHHHERSTSELVFARMNARFCERLRSKTRATQVNELLLKALCHDL